MNKDLIKKRFTKNLGTYNANAKIQQKMAEHLLSLTDKTDFNTILEIGCGTGLLTKLAVDKFKFKKYIANDIVEKCDTYIKDISKDIQFVNADIEEIIKNSNNKYDLIISNASFQWIENIEEFLKNLISKLNPNGVLLFSTFGPKNFSEIAYVIGKSLPYKSVKEYKKMLDSQNFYIEEENYTLYFDTPKDVLKHIKFTGVNAIDEKIWTKTDMFKFEKEYLKHCSDKPTLNYNPIYIRISI